MAVRGPLLEYSHFISLPLAIHPELVEKLNYFQNSILENPSSNQDRNPEIDLHDDDSNYGHGKGKQLEDVVIAVKSDTEDAKKHIKVGAGSRTIGKYSPKQLSASLLSDLGIDKSIFIKPEKIHLTVLMLKLWNKEHIVAATEVLQKISPKVLEALENRPISVRLKGLELMKGSPAKARVLYAPVEEIGGDGRLLRACQVIIEAYVEAGLVPENDGRRTFKLHATVMNTRYRERKGRSMAYDSFDARSILQRYGLEEWGEYRIREAHLSERSAYGESGYYYCCASIPFPENMNIR